MKRHYVRPLATFLTISLLLTSTLAAMAEPLNLPEGTTVRLKTINSISSSNSQEGASVNFQVMDDVTAPDNKTVLLKAGSSAWGQVTNAKKRGRIGSGGELAITVEGSTAVDGTKIPLRANLKREGQEKQGASIALSFFITPLFLLMRGKDAQVPAGTEISAYVDRTVAVNLPVPMAVAPMAETSTGHPDGSLSQDDTAE